MPAGQDHRIFNADPGHLELVDIFAATPVVTRTVYGDVLTLPWQSGAVAHAP